MFLCKCIVLIWIFCQNLFVLIYEIQKVLSEFYQILTLISRHKALYHICSSSRFYEDKAIVINFNIKTTNYKTLLK